MKTPVDNSLKLITATVAGMKHWNRFRDQLPVLFEIFGTNNLYLHPYFAISFIKISSVYFKGTLDSALSSNANGTAKNFLIKDESATLR